MGSDVRQKSGGLSQGAGTAEVAEGGHKEQWGDYEQSFHRQPWSEQQAPSLHRRAGVRELLQAAAEEQLGGLLQGGGARTVEEGMKRQLGDRHITHCQHCNSKRCGGHTCGNFIHTQPLHTSRTSPPQTASTQPLHSQFTPTTPAPTHLLRALQLRAVLTPHIVLLEKPLFVQFSSRSSVPGAKENRKVTCLKVVAVMTHGGVGEAAVCAV